MNILFLHQNAPGQFKHLASHLAHDPANRVVFLSQTVPSLPGPIDWLRYSPPRLPGPATHPYLRRFQASIARGQAVLRACHDLKRQGFLPDLVIAHPGWGESMFIRDLYPKTPILSYCEMFYRPTGQDGNFLPETALDFDGVCRLRAWNADLLTALDTMDAGLSPTAWQRAQHPAAYQPRIATIHDGIDLDEVRPNPAATFTLPSGRVLTAADEIVTFVARHLEPVRGFLTAMRALPTLLRLRPGAHVIFCGEDGVSYGSPPPGGGTWRATALRDIEIDPTRITFTGRLPRPAYLSLLQISTVHLYLTVPFVLSWSFTEALAAGCLVLAADVAPVRELLTDGHNGVLVDPRDPLAVALRTADLLAAAPTLAPLRNHARATALDRFDLRQCLRQQHALITRLAA